MTKLSIRLMGSFQTSFEALPITRFESDKVRALLAYLVVESDHTHRREKLAGLLWSDMPETRARRNLSQALYNLRNLFNDHQAQSPYLILTRDTVQFNTTSEYWLDVATFTQLLHAYGREDKSSYISDSCSTGGLQKAVELYRGDFLEGFTLDNNWAFDEWCLITRERLHRQVLVALFNLIELYEEKGEIAKALPYAWRQVELNPISESANRQLMRLLAASHQRSEALAQFTRFQSILAEELNVNPEYETLELYKTIKYNRKSKLSIQSKHHNLPEFITPFIGRQSELQELGELLIDPSCRLLTIMGPGGSGKTRLSLDVAKTNLSNFQHGVFLISLNPILSLDAMPSSIAKALDLPMQEKGDIQDQIINYLRAKNMLLLMDGFEHLLDGREILIEILRSAPRVKILVTSRVRLNIKGEHLYPLMGLECPETLTHNPSVQQTDALQLFLSGARRINPDFEPRIDDLEPMIHICRYVQGMPLGILLASTWISMMTPEEILSEIKQGLDFLSTEWTDVPSRQRSVRTTFDHSWDLLRVREQAIFRSLSVFRGDFTRSAARKVSGASPHELRALVDKSLLFSMQPGRYEMHELLRQYGAEKLAESNEFEKAACGRHSNYFCELLAKWDKMLKSHQQEIALDEMSREHENLRTAWNWASAHCEIDQLDRAMEGLCLYYDLLIRYREGRSACRFAREHITEKPKSKEGFRTQIRMLIWQSHFERLLGQQDIAIQLLEEGQTLYEQAQDCGYDVRAEKAFLLFERANNDMHNNRQAAAKNYQLSRQLHQELDDPWGTAAAIEGLGMVAHHTGRFKDSVHHYSKCLELHRSMGDPRGIANSAIGLGHNCLRQGQLSKGEKYIQEGSILLQQIRDLSGVARGYLELGRTYFWSGQFTRSFELVDKSRPIFDELGMQDQLVFASIAPSIGLSHLGRYDEAYSRALQGLRLAQVLDAQRETAMAYLCLGMASLGQGKYKQAKGWALKSVKTYREISQKDEEGWGLAVLVFAERGERQSSQAWSYLFETLRNGIEIHGIYPILCSLMAFALLLADRSDFERAIEIASLAKGFPLVSNSVWFEDIASREIEAIAITMPSNTVNAARKRGSLRDVWETAEELLDMDSVIHPQIADQV